MTPPHVRTAHEVTVARERAQRTARCVLHLLLRRGVCGYIEFARTLRARGDTVDRLRGAVTTATTAATATTTATTTTATAASATTASRTRRVNPEDVKAALHHCGVLLRSESHRVLLHAYSDSVGFVLADDLLRALAPLTHVSPSLQQCLWRHLAPWVLVQQHHDDNDDGGDDDTDGHSDDATRTCATAATTATVTLASARATLAHLFADTTTPRATKADTNDDDDSRAAVAVVMQRAQEQAQRCFAHDAYAGDRVPVVDVLDFVAAHALLLPSSSSMLCDGAASPCDGSATTAAAPCTLTTPSSSLSLPRLLRARAACAPALTPCCSDSSSDNSNSKDVLHTTTSSATALGAADATQQQQHPCASDDATHTFARYRDNVDRRDEWLRGCDAYTARPTYQTHVVGYAGHLPEYTRRFGRTFHVIEESLPHLGKLQQQEQQQQPQGVTAHDDKAAPDVDGAHVGDGSDTRIELKYSRMNKHHFTFA